MSTRIQRITERVKGIMSSVIRLQLPASEATKRWNDIMSSDDALKLTRIDRAYLRGWYESDLNRVWQLVEFCYIINGVQHSTHRHSIFPRVPAESMKGNVCAHYWKGTDKPYTEPRLID